jgi:hypothetical protein
MVMEISSLMMISAPILGEQQAWLSSVPKKTSRRVRKANPLVALCDVLLFRRNLAP